MKEPLQAGASSVELTVRTLQASSAYSTSTTEAFWLKRWKAFIRQDQGHRMLSWAREEFRGQLDAKKVRSYYPHPGNGNGVSFAQGSDKIHLTEGSGMSTLRHELGHSVYFQAGLISFGGAHSRSGPTHPKLAFAEGFATFLGNWAGATVGGEDGGQIMAGGGEHHPASPAPEDLRTRFLAMHHFNEVNVTCSLWDVADEEVDSFGLLPGLSDRVKGQGPRQVLADVRDDYAGKWNYLWNGRPTLVDLYRKKWRSRYGWLAAEALLLNGVNVGR